MCSTKGENWVEIVFWVNITYFEWKIVPLGRGECFAPSIKHKTFFKYTPMIVTSYQSQESKGIL